MKVTATSKFTRRDLVLAVSAATNLRQREASVAVDAVFDSIIEAIIDNRRCEIYRFGSFEPVVHPAHFGRNPLRPEETMKVPEKRGVKFRAGGTMRAAIAAGKPRKAK